MIWNSHFIDETITEKYYICRRERSEDTDIPCFGHNCLLQSRVIVVIHIVYAHDLRIAEACKNRLHKIAAYESGSSGHKNPHVI